MNEHPVVSTSTSEDEVAFWGKNRLVILLIGTVGIALILTCVSIAIYNSSGAAQLDLSRPGLRSVSSQVEKDDASEGFNASGSVTKETINEFITMYEAQAKKAKGVDAFSGDPLNPEVLVFSTSSSDEN